MNVTVEKQPKCLVNLSATVPAEDVAKEKANILNTYASQAQIPGFRPGKAPKRVIEKRFGKAVESELEQQFLQKVLSHGIKEEELDIMNISAQSCTHEENGDFAISLTLTVEPNVELPEYKNIPVTVPTLEVTDEMVEEEVLNFRRQSAEYPTKEEGAVEEGDVAVISFAASYEGKPAGESFDVVLAPYDAKEEFWIKAGEDQFLPGFSSELINMVVGSEKTFPHTFADEFAIEALRGKTLDYTVTVTEIKTEVLEDEETLAGKMFSAEQLEEGETATDKMRSTLRDYIGGQMEKQIQDLKFGTIMETLREQIDFELPDDLLQQETQSQADSIVQRGVSQGIAEEEVMKMEADIVKNASTQAEISLKNHFILQAIAKAEEIEVTEQEVSQAALMQAYQSGGDIKKVMDDIQKNGGGQYRHNLIMDKVVAILVEAADVTEEAPSSDED